MHSGCSCTVAHLPQQVSGPGHPPRRLPGLGASPGATSTLTGSSTTTTPAKFGTRPRPLPPWYARTRRKRSQPPSRERLTLPRHRLAPPPSPPATRPSLHCGRSNPDPTPARQHPRLPRGVGGAFVMSPPSRTRSSHRIHAPCRCCPRSPDTPHHQDQDDPRHEGTVAPRSADHHAIPLATRPCDARTGDAPSTRDPRTPIPHAHCA